MLSDTAAAHYEALVTNRFRAQRVLTTHLEPRVWCIVWPTFSTWDPIRVKALIEWKSRRGCKVVLLSANKTIKIAIFCFADASHLMLPPQRKECEFIAPQSQSINNGALCLVFIGLLKERYSLCDLHHTALYNHSIFTDSNRDIRDDTLLAAQRIYIK